MQANDDPECSDEAVTQPSILEPAAHGLGLTQSDLWVHSRMIGPGTVTTYLSPII